MVGDQVRIGYSFWGFLGRGITDTPDGGRSHRRILVDGITASGHEIVFLQRNRDLHEAGQNLTGAYTWAEGTPPVDALFLEWRWPITGRSTTRCGSVGHTCDLHRQDELIKCYTRRGTPTVIWDKDLRLPLRHPLRNLPNVTVCEAALLPRRGASQLLFPVRDTDLDTASPAALAAQPRPLPLAYAGNQYDRDDQFSVFFAPAAAAFPHRVAGKWPGTAAWPHVNFTGRCPFPEVRVLYRSALATILLLPERYARVGQMTQRLPEAVLAGCLPVTPANIACAAAFTPPALHASDGQQVTELITQITAMAGTAGHAGLIRDCLDRLAIFRASSQVAALNQILGKVSYASPAFIRRSLPGSR